MAPLALLLVRDRVTTSPRHPAALPTLLGRVHGRRWPPPPVAGALPVVGSNALVDDVWHRGHQARPRPATRSGAERADFTVWASAGSAASSSYLAVLILELAITLPLLLWLGWRRRASTAWRCLLALACCCWPSLRLALSGRTASAASSPFRHSATSPLTNETERRRLLKFHRELDEVFPCLAEFVQFVADLQLATPCVEHEVEHHTPEVTHATLTLILQLALITTPGHAGRLRRRRLASAPSQPDRPTPAATSRLRPLAATRRHNPPSADRTGSRCADRRAGAGQQPPRWLRLRPSSRASLPVPGAQPAFLAFAPLADTARPGLALVMAYRPAPPRAWLWLAHPGRRAGPPGRSPGAPSYTLSALGDFDEDGLANLAALARRGIEACSLRPRASLRVSTAGAGQRRGTATSTATATST